MRDRTLLIMCGTAEFDDALDHDKRKAGAVRKLIYGMNLTLDGYIAAAGDDIGWSGPSDELFQWWLDQERASSLSLYGRIPTLGG